MNMNRTEEIKRYIEEKVLPCYDAFDMGHQRNHAQYVMDTALQLAAYYPVDKDIVLMAAACHDLGLCEDRKTHHLVSGRIIRESEELRRWFSEEEVETIAQAAEDHRASSDHEPRTIYGKIIAEADRQIIPEVVIRRTIQFGFKHYPELGKEGHWQRTVEHLDEKYSDHGYLQLWIPESPNAARLEELRAIIRDSERLRAIFEKVYIEELWISQR